MNHKLVRTYLKSGAERLDNPTTLRVPLTCQTINTSSLGPQNYGFSEHINSSHRGNPQQTGNTHHPNNLEHMKLRKVVKLEAEIS